MINPLRHDLALAIHRERVNEGLRRASLSAEKPPGRRRGNRRRFQLRLRMA
jgi:hypothetical protein